METPILVILVTEFEPNFSEESEDEEVEDEGEQHESAEEAVWVVEENIPEIARGAVRGNRGVRGRRGRGRGRENPARITREEQERLLEAKWTSVVQDPQIPQFTATPTNPVQVTLLNFFSLMNCLICCSHKQICMRHNIR